MGRPRNRLQPFRGDGAAASDAGPECARVEPPDGLYHLGEVLFVALAEREIALLLEDLARGSGLRRLTQGSSIDTEPCFSPDGQSIYFTSDRGGQPQIYKMSAQGENAGAAGIF